MTTTVVRVEIDFLAVEAGSDRVVRSLHEIERAAVRTMRGVDGTSSSLQRLRRAAVDFDELMHETMGASNNLKRVAAREGTANGLQRANVQQGTEQLAGALQAGLPNSGEIQAALAPALAPLLQIIVKIIVGWIIGKVLDAILEEVQTTLNPENQLELISDAVEILQQETNVGSTLNEQEGIQRLSQVKALERALQELARQTAARQLAVTETIFEKAAMRRPNIGEKELFRELQDRLNVIENLLQRLEAVSVRLNDLFPGITVSDGGTQLVGQNAFFESFESRAQSLQTIQAELLNSLQLFDEALQERNRILQEMLRESGQSPGASEVRPTDSLQTTQDDVMRLLQDVLTELMRLLQEIDGNSLMPRSPDGGSPQPALPLPMLPDIQDNTAQTPQSICRSLEDAEAASQSFADAARRAFETYANSATNAGAQVEGVIGGALMNMENALVQFVQTGKLNFSQLVDSLLADLIRLTIRAAILGPLARAIGAAFGGGGGVGVGSTVISGGNTPFQPGGGEFVINGARGLDFTVPPGFPNDSFVTGLGLTSGERVSVMPSGQSAGAPVINQTIINETGAEVQTQERSNGAGGIDQIIRLIRKDTQLQMSEGMLGRITAQRFGLASAAVVR